MVVDKLIRQEARQRAHLQQQHSAFLERMVSSRHQQENDDEENDQDEPPPSSTISTCVQELVVQLLLERSPRSALMVDAKDGRLPLTHAWVGMPVLHP